MMMKIESIVFSMSLQPLQQQSDGGGSDDENDVEEEGINKIDIPRLLLI